MNQKIEQFFADPGQWQAEFSRLRAVVLDTGLIETFKWRNPCYTTDDDKNVVIIGGFKKYCALSFFNGALLKDPEQVLISPGENSQYSRLIPFTSVQQIDELESVIKAYIAEAVANEKAGKQVKAKAHEDYEIPAELEAKFVEAPAFRDAFYALTPGRQRGYLLHFAGAKQSKTRTARIEKYSDRIFDGKGMQDCVCGHSKRLPSCDGSHKYL